MILSDVLICTVPPSSLWSCLCKNTLWEKTCAVFFGTKRAEPRPVTQPHALSHAMMRPLSGRRLALFGAMALISCRALRFHPYLSFVRRLRGGARDGAPAPSKDLLGLSSRKDWNELEMIFSYDGWRRDADEAEEHHARYGEASDMLDSMRRKQQLHSGDRSHPFVRKLDALTPTLSYDGWKEDARIIE